MSELQAIGLIRVYKQGESLNVLKQSFFISDEVTDHLFQDEVYAQTVWPAGYLSVEDKILYMNALLRAVDLENKKIDLNKVEDILADLFVR